MAGLPQLFCEKMQDLLKDEYTDFISGYDNDNYYSLRVNTLKADIGSFVQENLFSLEKVDWCDTGFYYDNATRPGRHPYHHAGVYYIQEASAMAPVAAAGIQPGDKVLDLCAAPGGKSTQAAAALAGSGLLVSNEIVPSRAKILSGNLERMGVKNAIVLNENPADLEKHFPGFFDKIIVDAPCSGEGMFRKDDTAIKEWSPRQVDVCANRQSLILESAHKMLAPGGRLVYSTCTFAPEENEKMVASFIEKHPEYSVIKPAVHRFFSPGRPEWAEGPEEIAKAIRIWPHRMEGEGHFVALLKKSADAEGAPCTTERVRPAKVSEEAEAFLKRLGLMFSPERIIAREDRLYYLPEGLPDLSGLRILRSGLLLGEMKKNRFEPSQALACALKAEEYDNCYNLSAEDEDVIRYLKCETIDAKTPVADGFVLVCVDGYPLGWGKAAKGVIKNKYLAGWRMM